MLPAGAVLPSVPKAVKRPDVDAAPSNARLWREMDCGLQTIFGSWVVSCANRQTCDPSWIRADRHHFRYIFLRSAQDWSEVPEGAERYELHFAT